MSFDKFVICLVGAFFSAGLCAANGSELRGLGNKCLDLRGGTPTDQTPVQIYTCHGGENQNWTLRNGAIIGMNDKCLDVRGGNPNDETRVQIFTCDGGASQRWEFTEQGQLRGLGGKCLDVRGGNSTDGTDIQIFGCHLGQSQKWVWALHATVYIDQLNAITITEAGIGNSRDELYLLLSRSSPNEKKVERLPRNPDGNDYYEFVNQQNANAANHADWTNRDQAPLGRPLLWSGELIHTGSVVGETNGTTAPTHVGSARQQAAELMVVVGEQDNKDPGKLKQIINGACRAAGSAAEADTAAPQADKAAAKGAVEACTGLAGLLPDNTLDDILGAFSVRLTNNMGQLETAWIAISDIHVREGERGSTVIKNSNDPYAVERRSQGVEAQSFTLTGVNGATYELVAAVDLSRIQKSAWEYLSRESDGCPRSTVSIRRYDGQLIPVPRGGSADAEISNRDFRWFCGGHEERAVCPLGTTVVVAHRPSGSDDISWTCMRRIDFH